MDNGIINIGTSYVKENKDMENTNMIIKYANLRGFLSMKNKY